ncbi:stress responsive a/b barrel domain-containing protein [Toxoplasma gondii TgCatPRC2]|uniref:Stress responsive a/b barrel domain-containing protein n=14 Tax=Toxoplasma gondii TaxID=5811 RepID=B9PYW6_TOXGV|nr:stress responsive a/b barrel domain-containing protein [Toxoplasma gondii ME49]EPR58433.1 stress responsive a/b barrel domain-containing protein [Toxoplasma gondii GT1]ESS29991.1 stress responsive a/b barrel domain-containing protein [Toxoplasma gondii VEG]KAF4645668.1 stress responsive a/b barrel domain-containing protein [Toxoplasma gondii]KFG35982.1 stress responsive a/b barrel domain-containing protein [Toxoplasma gondii p89]KFG41771.1 stress responsive a/b barrel domain-containing prot|eukprot:XP_002370072.1 stress responsive a/b barrel domain-containing protein [Toxoplasma gondii ME49]
MAYGLRHIVCFKFKPATPAELLEQFIQDGRQLKALIPELDFFIDMRTSVTEDRTKGFSHFLYSEFHGKDQLQVYAEHPKHKEFVAKFKPHFEDVMAFDLPM